MRRQVAYTSSGKIKKAGESAYALGRKFFWEGSYCYVIDKDKDILKLQCSLERKDFGMSRWRFYAILVVASVAGGLLLTLISGFYATPLRQAKTRATDLSVVRSGLILASSEGQGT